jgi:hypothetical protein
MPSATRVNTERGGNSQLAQSHVPEMLECAPVFDFARHGDAIEGVDRDDARE